VASTVDNPVTRTVNDVGGAAGQPDLGDDVNSTVNNTVDNVDNTVNNVVDGLP
jgi:hypothetical protein